MARMLLSRRRHNPRDEKNDVDAIQFESRTLQLPIEVESSAEPVLDDNLF